MRSVLKTLRYVPWRLYFLVPLLYGALHLRAIASETQEAAVPVCDDCDERWNWWITVFQLYRKLAVIALPTVFGFIGDEVYPRGGFTYGGIAGVLVWGWGLFGIYALGLRKVAPTCREIDRSSALLRLPNASLLQTAWEEDR